MASKKKTIVKPPSPAAGEVHRVNMTLTVDEYEMLVEVAAKMTPPSTPTVLAKHFVMKALEDVSSSSSSSR